MTAGEGGGATSPTGSSRHFFSAFFFFFWLNILDLVGSCWSCMRIYEELCLNLVGSCLKTNKSERSCWIFSNEWMLLIKNDEELYNVTEISEQILKNFV
jgi:hypothetical protein